MRGEPGPGGGGGGGDWDWPLFGILQSRWVPFYAQLDIVTPPSTDKSVCLYHILFQR